MPCPTLEDMALTLSLNPAELPREVQCRLRAGPKKMVFVFVFFVLFCFLFMVLEYLTSFMVPASCTREHQCNPHLRDTEITHKDAGGLSHGEQGGRETQVLRTPVDPEKRGCFLPLETAPWFTDSTAPSSHCLALSLPWADTWCPGRLSTVLSQGCEDPWDRGWRDG